MQGAERRSSEMQSQLARKRSNRVRAHNSKQLERAMLDFAANREPTTIDTEAMPRRSRLDDILMRHRRRRIRAVAMLVLWTVLCGSLLAM
jgi:hypothetical protein